MAPPAPPVLHQRGFAGVFVQAGSMILAGRETRWCNRDLRLTWNPSWFKHRVDAIIVDEDYGPLVIEGTPAFWSKVPPECAEGQILLSTVQVPSRLQALLTRWRPCRYSC